MQIPSGRAILAAEVVGEGALDVLLLHAGVADRRSWAPVVARLDGLGRCLTFDSRGYGATAYEPEDGWSRVADAVAVLDAVGADRACVIGCSLGGGTALDLALAHPDRVSSLVLIAPAVSGAPEPELEPEVARLDALMEAADEAEDLDELNRLEVWTWLDGPLQPEGRVGGAAREHVIEANGRALAAPDAGRQDSGVAAWDRVAEIPVPTLCLVGDYDLSYSRENTARVAAALPQGRLLPLSGVAHLPHLEEDEATLAAIEAFVRDLARAGS